MDSSLTRRFFLGSTLLSGIGLWWYQGKAINKVYAPSTQVILHAAYHLFPGANMGPSAHDLNMAHYLAFVLEDKRLLKADVDYFLQGAQWLEESAYETYEKSFLHLSTSKKEALFQEIAQRPWGENFIYTVLGYVLEALLSAPVYGSNQEGMGWQWLSHNPGFPQPINQEQIRYAL